MYYSAYDKQLGQYFETGKNSRNRATCMSRVVDYLVQGAPLPTQEYDDIPDEEILDLFDVRIDEHSKPLEEKPETKGLKELA